MNAPAKEDLPHFPSSCFPCSFCGNSDEDRRRIMGPTCSGYSTHIGSGNPQCNSIVIICEVCVKLASAELEKMRELSHRPSSNRS